LKYSTFAPAKYHPLCPSKSFPASSLLSHWVDAAGQFPAVAEEIVPAKMADAGVCAGGVAAANRQPSGLVFGGSRSAAVGSVWAAADFAGTFQGRECGASLVFADLVYVGL